MSDLVGNPNCWFSHVQALRDFSSKIVCALMYYVSILKQFSHSKTEGKTLKYG